MGGREGKDKNWEERLGNKQVKKERRKGDGVQQDGGSNEMKEKLKKRGERKRKRGNSKMRVKSGCGKGKKKEGTKRQRQEKETEVRKRHKGQKRKVKCEVKETSKTSDERNGYKRK